MGPTASSFPKGRLPAWRHGGRSTLWAAFWTLDAWSRAPDITLASFIPSQLLKLRTGQNKGLQRPQMTMVPGGKAALPYFPPCQVGLVIKPGTMSSAQIEFFGSVLRKENTSFKSPKQHLSEALTPPIPPSVYAGRKKHVFECGHGEGHAVRSMPFGGSARRRHFLANLVTWRSHSGSTPSQDHLPKAQR